MDKVNILGVHVDMVNISQATDCIMRFLDEDKFHAVYTPNSEIIMLAYKDEKFCKLLNNADLLTADGIGVVHASKILKKPISERAAGYDIARQVLQKMNYTDHKLFLFGGKPGVAEEAKKKLLEEYTDLNIVGTRNGYFKPEEEAEIVEEINNSGADIVLYVWVHLSRNSGLKETEMHLKYALRWALAEVLTYLPEKLNAHLKYSVKQVWNGFTDFAKNLGV